MSEECTVRTSVYSSCDYDQHSSLIWYCWSPVNTAATLSMSRYGYSARYTVPRLRSQSHRLNRQSDDPRRIVIAKSTSAHKSEARLVITHAIPVRLSVHNTNRCHNSDTARSASKSPDAPCGIGTNGARRATSHTPPVIKPHPSGHLALLNKHSSAERNIYCQPPATAHLSMAILRVVVAATLSRGPS